MGGAAQSAQQGWREKGTEVRSRRAALKRGIREGSIDAIEIIAGSATTSLRETAADMPLVSLLLAIPGIGDKTVQALLQAREIPAEARLWALTDERRRELADAVREAIE